MWAFVILLAVPSGLYAGILYSKLPPIIEPALLVYLPQQRHHYNIGRKLIRKQEIGVSIVPRLAPSLHAKYMHMTGRRHTLPMHAYYIPARPENYSLSCFYFFWYRKCNDAL